MNIWLQFLVCLGVIGVAGYHLSRYGDAIAEKTGLSRSWVGLALIASITSLPELATGISSVTVARVPDIAVGDVLGSCVFNLLILVVLDFLYRRESVYTRARQGHILNAGYGVALIGFTGFNLLLYQQDGMPAIAHVGLYTPILLIFYALAMRSLFRYEREQVGAFIEEEKTYPHMTLRQSVIGYGAAGIAVVVAGTWLPFIGEEIAELMGWEQSFVGTLFVAAVTSTPEMVVTVSALRLGVVDMAIGGLLGSNLFNIAILAVDDLFYMDGPLFAGVSSAHAASALSAMMMTGVAIIGLMLRPRSRVFRMISWVSLWLFALYLLNSLFLYLYGG